MARDKAKPSNLVDPAKKKQFLEMRDHWEKLNEQANKLAGKRRQYQAEIKEAGFKMQQIKDSILLSTPEGEEEFKAQMANRMLAAAYSDADIGDQLSLFVDPDRTPAIDRAAKEGQTAAMENKAHAPPYDQSTDQYRAWSEAFYAEQERQVTKGIKKIDDKKGGKGGKKGKEAQAGTKRRGRPPGSGKAKGPNADPAPGSERTLIPKAEKDAKEAKRNPPKDDAPPRRPAATPVTRSTAAASRNAARETAESYFTKSEPAGNA